MKERIYGLIREALERASCAGVIPRVDEVPFAVEYPPDEAFGDYASNVALVLGSALKRKPRDVAQAILDHLPPAPYIEKVEVVSVGRVRRAKLYYLRKLRGKAARIREKRSF